MTTATLVVEENDANLKSDVVQEMLKQLKAIDTFDTYEGWSEAKIIDPVVLTKERKREIPVIGDPDEITMSRIKAYYNTLSSLIEVKTGLMAVPMINLSHEGFGRAIVMVGKLIVVDKVLRDVHRWGFPTLDKMVGQTNSTIDKAVALIEKYNDAAKD